MTKTDWNPILRTELAKPYWAELQQFVVAENDVLADPRRLRHLDLTLLHD